MKQKTTTAVEFKSESEARANCPSNKEVFITTMNGKSRYWVSAHHLHVSHAEFLELGGKVEKAGEPVSIDDVSAMISRLSPEDRKKLGL
jgi:hypothetical protein